MAINRIFARSPFIVEINQPTQEGSKVELYIYQNGNPPPTSPSYTLEKLIPASNNTQTLYNISPYLLEYIEHTTFNNNYATDEGLLNVSEYILVDVMTYWLDPFTQSYQLLTNYTYWAYDGFGYYSQGYNPSHIFTMPVHLDKKDYYFWSDANNNPLLNSLQRAGTFTAYLETHWTVKEILNGLAVIWTATFYPIEECKYDVHVVDFINMYGAWQREFFFKASYEGLETSTTEFNLMQEMGLFGSWDTQANQRQTFNTNGIISYRVNTGWVDESFSSNLQQLMLSERILLNNEPVKLKTKSIDKQKSINNHMINYVLEFEQSNDLINNVI
ncbi:MAG: hypothetical protein EBU53_02975 [Proteobacteria bacterium]|nr:hypothetical protein [Pseudomonadota bacterium]